MVRMTFLGGAAETLTRDGKYRTMFTRRSQGTPGVIKSRQRGGGKTREVLNSQISALRLPEWLLWVVILTRTFRQQLPSTNLFSCVLN